MHALRNRGWSISAIARHTGRDRKTVRRYLRGGRPSRKARSSCLEPYREYVSTRFAQDPHLPATELHRELRGLGFDRSYPTLVRELRKLELRPRCMPCRAGSAVAAEIALEPGAELQLDWLELEETPWGAPTHVLVGALPWSGRLRGVIAEGQGFARLVAALDGLLRRFGGTPHTWRAGRMTTVCDPETSGIRPQFAEVAQHYGAAVAVCPPDRPQQKSAVETAVRYLTRTWWRSAPVSSPAQAQADLDRFATSVADRRRRDDGTTVAQLAEREPLLALPATPFPVILEAERVVTRSALVPFEGNRYSVGPELAGQQVTVRTRLGELYLEVLSAARTRVARHRRAPAGAGQTVRTDAHSRALRAAIVEELTTGRGSHREVSVSPGEVTRATVGTAVG